MLKIILAESELELIPEEVKSHPSLRKLFRRKSSVLLDSNYHHKAMRKLPDSYRRGRPDIIHICALCVLESPLNKNGGLEFYIHTRNDEVIHVSPFWKVPKSYNRFVGLMEQLFEKRTIKAQERELLRMEKKKLGTLIDEISSGMKVKVMHYEGSSYASEDNCVVIVGGFPHGDFINELSYEKFSIFSEELVAWSVLNHVVFSLHV
ncbi:MAG: 16S rRNA methyltransferase [Candidatus Methanofastidiosia archaeon]